MKRYPEFVPPVPSEIPPKQWPEEQARRYLVWLTSNVDRRADQLLEFLGFPVSGHPDSVLEEVGREASAKLHEREFSILESGHPKLTDSGYALAADLGLLVAKLLLENAIRPLRWEVLRKPKTDAFYNHPVLVGFDGPALEPVGGSIAEAYGVLRQERTSSIWRMMYIHWLSKAQ